MASGHEYANQRAAPITICEGSGCPIGCLLSEALVSALHSSGELGPPGGQKGMYRSQGEEEKQALMSKGRL